MKADGPLARLKEIAPSELRWKLTIFQDPQQHPDAHQRLMEMLDEVGAKCTVVSTTETLLGIQWMVGSGHGYALIREGSNFDEWRIAGEPQSTQYLDFQVVNSNIEAELNRSALHPEALRRDLIGVQRVVRHRKIDRPILRCW